METYIPKSSSIPMTRKPASPRPVHHSKPVISNQTSNPFEPTAAPSNFETNHHSPNPKPSTDFQFEELFVSEIPGLPVKRPLKEAEDLKILENEKEDEEDEGTDSTNPEIGEGETLEPSSSHVNLEDFTILKMIGKGAYGKVCEN